MTYQAEASVARRYNRQPGERSQVWRRTVDNASLRRLTRAGRRQQTRNRAYLGGGVGRRGGARSSTHDGRLWRQRKQRQRRATSGAVTTSGDSGRQRPRVAPSADRNVHGPRRQRGVTSASRNVERRYVSERRDISEPQRQRTATTAWCDVSEPQRRAPLRQRAARHQRAATSADRDDCVV